MIAITDSKIGTSNDKILHLIPIGELEKAVMAQILASKLSSGDKIIFLSIYFDEALKEKIRKVKQLVATIAEQANISVYDYELYPYNNVYELATHILTNISGELRSHSNIKIYTGSGSRFLVFALLLIGVTLANTGRYNVDIIVTPDHDQTIINNINTRFLTEKYRLGIKQTSILRILLKNSASLQEIAGKIHISPSHTHKIIKKLIERGLVTTIRKNGVNYYVLTSYGKLIASSLEVM